MLFLDGIGNGFGHKMPEWTTLGDTLADVGAADVDERCLQQPNALWERRWVDVIAPPGIDDYVTMCKNVLRMIPSWKRGPVVGSDDERKPMGGEVAGEGLQGVPRI